MFSSNNNTSSFSGKIRMRVMGLLHQEDAFLMVLHKGLGPKNELWLPPGGGIEFGESAEEALIREFKQETNLKIVPKKYLFLSQFRAKDIHAYEIFYEVTYQSGELRTGFDPELSSDNQLISDVRFLSFTEIEQMDAYVQHHAFRQVATPKNILDLKGLVSFNY